MFGTYQDNEVPRIPQLAKRCCPLWAKVQVKNADGNFWALLSDHRQGSEPRSEVCCRRSALCAARAQVPPEQAGRVAPMTPLQVASEANTDEGAEALGDLPWE